MSKTTNAEWTSLDDVPRGWERAVWSACQCLIFRYAVKPSPLDQPGEIQVSLFGPMVRARIALDDGTIHEYRQAPSQTGIA